MSGKSRFYKKYLFLAGLAVLAIAGAVFAYSPHYTHPDLTEEMVKFYNASGQQKIGNEFLRVLRQGSIDEDTDPRWINHFYDPQSGEGWTGEHLGPHSKEMIQGVSNTLVAMNFTPLPAPKWAEDQEAQNKFINYGWNHTWQKAIYDYANGREKEAFESLGYILHLIEDMSVPDHTRNDSHPHVAGDPGSPYEEWAKAYTNSHKLDTAEKLLSEQAAIPKFSNLKEAFDYTAKYSNENFFSEETINDKKYTSPRATNFETEGEITYAYGVLQNAQRIVLYKFSNQDVSTATLNDELILYQYFFLLSRRSVLAGAGVIELFFKEAEKAKNDPSMLEKPPAPPTAMGTLGAFMLTRVVSPLGLVSPLARGIYGAFNALRSTLFASVGEISPNEPRQPVVETSLPRQGGASEDVADANLNLDVGRLSESAPPPAAAAPALPEELASQARAEDGENNSPLFLQLQAVGGSSPGFGGGGEVISASSAQTFSSQNQEAAPAPTLDTTPPDISLSVSECASSLSSDGCLLASSTVSLVWSSAASDLNRYVVECALGGTACSGFNFASTTATSTIYSLPTDDSSYIFKAKAVDNTGNESGETTKTISFSARPVVINEIAWAGTSASANDKWIELYNKSSQSVNLANWVLYAQDGVPYINLSGAVSAGGYYLIERADNAVRDIAADLVAPFSGLGTETLILSRASTTIDQTVLCSNNWCGGASGGAYPTMEKIDPDIAGTDSTNWGTSNSGASNGFMKNGKDSAGANLTATPARQEFSALFNFANRHSLGGQNA